MIKHCFQSLEVCDRTGKKILHHLINRLQSVDGNTCSFFSKICVNSLLDLQDDQGNTVMHLAVIHKDFNMLQLFDRFEYYSQACDVIRDKQGSTANDLIRQTNLELELKKLKNIISKETCQAIEQRLDDLKYYLKNPSLLHGKKDDEGRNILHKLFYFIETRDNLDHNDELFSILNDNFPSHPNDILIETEKNGDSPLHLFARLKPIFSMQVLNVFKDRALLSSSASIKQNLKGNTAAHEAVIAHNHHIVLEYLVEANEEATSLVNQNNETLLHLLATHPILFEATHDETFPYLIRMG